MGRFLESEKQRLAAFKDYKAYFSSQSREDGLFQGKMRSFCLPQALADENLFPEIRRNAVESFDRLGIKWHQGVGRGPSNHLCDSQVCCVNFLMPFHDRPEELSELLKSHYPEITSILPIKDEGCVAFEWIGADNYLGERAPKSGNRSRGANCTSADAIVLFERADSLRQAVLIEWKYTESYGKTDLTIAPSGTDRTAIYRHLYEAEDCPINKTQLPSFEFLFFEPFYQLMRQQFLAHQMEKHKELGADIVSTLHITPDRNLDFKKVTSPGLAHLGDSPTHIWSRLVNPPDRYISLSTETLFGPFLQHPPESMHPWAKYLLARFPWLSQDDDLC